MRASNGLTVAAHVPCADAGGQPSKSDVLLYASAATATRALGLDTIGIGPTATACSRSTRTSRRSTRTSTPWGTSSAPRPWPAPRWSRGGRRFATLYGIPGAEGRERPILPFAIYSIPEVDYIGDDRRACREARAIPYVAGDGRIRREPGDRSPGRRRGDKLLSSSPSLEARRRAHHRPQRERADPHGQAFFDAGARRRRYRRNASTTIRRSPTCTADAALKAVAEERSRG